MIKMFKQNRSTIAAPSSSACPQGYVAASSDHQDRSGQRSQGSYHPHPDYTLNVNKYSMIGFSNSSYITANYSYNVHKYTIHDDYAIISTDDSSRKGPMKYHDDIGGHNGSYLDDNYHEISCKNPCRNENDRIGTENSSRGDEAVRHVNGSSSKGNEEEEDDSFTFSSGAGSKEYFNSKSSASCGTDREADACLLMRKLSPTSMSPADELFLDGKIRPLIQPISKALPLSQLIVNSHPTIDGYDNFLQSGKPMPLTPPINSNDHDLPTTQCKSFRHAHAFFDEYTAASAKPTVISKQVLHAGGLDYSQQSLRQNELDCGVRSAVYDELLHQVELNHGVSSESRKLNGELVQSTERLELLDHESSREINGASEDILYHIEPADNVGGLTSLQIVSSSAPASPVKEKLASVQTTHPSYATISTSSQLSCYKKCRSLSRVFHLQDTERVLQVQGLVEDRTKSSSFQLHCKRETLQDLLSQEGDTTSKPVDGDVIKELSYKIIEEEKSLPSAKPNRNSRSFNYAQRAPASVLPAAPIINIPHVWPIKQKLSAPPTSKGKGVNHKVKGIHELHYESQKAQAEKLKKTTFLPYRPALLGCIGYAAR